MLAANLGNGVQACYRGPRLYDTDTTKALVKGWVDFYKEHRDILESDIIHSSSRRADGRGLDWMLHANPKLKEKGFLMIFNPTMCAIQKSIRLNLYYTGLTGSVEIRSGDGTVRRGRLNREYELDLEVELEGGESKWVAFF